jgi:Abnormal spindle-like microcephaly-assoc'd, ASPM-SPD-2-Hydin
MKFHFGRHLASLSLSCLLLAGLAAPASAQFKLQQDFKGTAATGWTLTNSATLTAPSIDAAGSGWLRLTDTGLTEKGLALNNTFSFAGSVPVVVEFDYVSWGGTGADGMTLFLYDSTTASPMANALTGGGLGYCAGAGGYLAIGIDEYGNFSNPGDKCGNASGGPGAKPESLVIRGPASASNAWISTTSVPGGIDNPHATTRPSPKTVIFTLTPAVSPAIGYTITAQFRSAADQPFQTLFSNVPFPYAPPANLSVGLSGSTGGSTNFHELRGLAAATPDDLQVTMTGPSSILQGSSVTYNVTVTNNGNNTLSGADSPTVLDSLPSAITAAAWTCIASTGGSCDASGTGNINTSNVTLPANGSITYTITGTLDPGAACGTTVGNTANADFTTTTRFLDPDETNNSATVNSTVICNTTLVANPASLSFGPQAVGVASTSQAITVTEGMNSSTITSIAVTGDYSQTNNCPAALSAGQTCTINVTFTPSVEGSSNGSLTILSNANASPTVTSTVMLSGTGTNSVPSAFSFTPLVNVDPSSVQVSNAVTVTNTNVPSPISVSAGGQYSINGGPFTSVAGVVSPGAQVTVQLAAASGYGTSDSAVLTIGGVSSTFTVTTGAQPVLQGSFTPVTGAAPSSTQTSSVITVVGTTIPVPISVSNGSSYSINGGPFTSTAGTVQPGDQVVVQTTSASTYNTTDSAIVNIGGVTSTFTVTTAAQPPQLAGFTPVTGSSVGVLQMSSPITFTGTAAAPISVSSGGEYSINGGPFTAAPGMVQPGDQVVVEISAPSSYDSSATAVLTISNLTSSFVVTTGAEPVLQGSFTSVASSAPSSTQISNPVTVTGITTPAVISITGGQYSINGGAFTSATGTVQPGDQVTVQMTAPSTYGTTATSTLTIDGVSTNFSVSTAQQPLNVAVTGGGGAMTSLLLLALTLLVAFRAVSPRRAAMVMPIVVLVGAGLLSVPARADDGSWASNLYGGVRAGASTSSMTAGKLTRDLQSDGYDVTASGSERGTATGTLYIGYELPDLFAVEVAGSYVGRTRAALEGVQQSNLQPLLNDAARIVRGSGDIVAVEARYRWPLASFIDLDLRAGPYLWITRTDVYVSGADQLHRTDNGIGYTLGLGPRFAFGQHIGVGVAADFLQSTSESHFVLFSATLEYHFR